MNQDEKIVQEFENEKIQVDVVGMLKYIRKKIVWILGAAIICTIIAFIGAKVLIEPTYTSVTKAYILSKQEGQTNPTYADLQIGSFLTKDYMTLVTSRPVLEQTIRDLNLDMSLQELANSIIVDTPTESRILIISVENSDPKTAQDIANTIRQHVSEQIESIMDTNTVNVVEEANLPEMPSGPNVTMYSILGGMFGVLAVTMIFVLIYLLDDTIKTSEDVEKYMKLNVLAMIPKVEKNKRKIGVER